MRIALGAAVAFLLVWMVALRPKTEEVPAPAAAPAPNVQTGAPAQSAPGQAVQQAQGAANAASANAAASAGTAAAPTTPATGAAPATAPANGAKPADTATKVDASSGLPLTVLRAIADKKVLVMLFWNPKASDDAAVRRELRQVKGKGVFTHVADIKSVARYASITRGVNLAQSPTVVVVDRKLQATPLTGFVDASEIRQVVADAKRVKP
jgi:hypothetical protein